MTVGLNNIPVLSDRNDRTTTGFPESSPVADARSMRRQEDGVSADRLLGGEDASTPQDRVTVSEEARELQQLQARDAEVRAHEAAHAAAGGQYAGAPTYTFETGPDGRKYAVGGEVSINASSIAGDPEATIAKMQQVRAAALAPAEPSSTDLRIAAKAAAAEAAARSKLAQEGYGRQPAGAQGAATTPSLETLSVEDRSPGVRTQLPEFVV